MGVTFLLGYGGEQMGSPEEKDKPSTTLPGTVEKIIKPIVPSEPEKAQVSIEGGRNSIVRFGSTTS
jgi:hypothetical protein